MMLLKQKKLLMKSSNLLGKGEKMYIVRFNGKKLNLKSLTGFKKYEQVRNALRKYLRSKGQTRIHGALGYTISRV
jgi:hypothetical protein